MDSDTEARLDLAIAQVEALARPEEVVERFLDWLGPQGLLIAQLDRQGRTEPTARTHNSLINQFLER